MEANPLRSHMEWNPAESFLNPNYKTLSWHFPPSLSADRFSRSCFQAKLSQAQQLAAPQTTFPVQEQSSRTTIYQPTNKNKMRLPTTTSLLLLLLLALTAAAAPTAKDFLRPLPGTEDLGLKTGRIGVDKVDLSRLRVDPVSVDAHRGRGQTSSATRRDSEPDPAVDEVHRPSPYPLSSSELGAREEQVVDDDEVIPKWRKKFDVEANWLED